MAVIDNRLEKLRVAMRDHGIDATIVPSGDAHQSEYVADYWTCREWISGFTGSAGVAIVTAEHAGVYTDGRYFIQAEDELSDSEFVLHKYSNQFASEEAQYLSEHLPTGSIVGINGLNFSVSKVRSYKSILSQKGIELRVDIDLFDDIWQDRPALTHQAIYEHDISFTGKSRVEKVQDVRDQMLQQGASHHLITTLDDIGWMLNLRGSDVVYNPVFFSYVLIDVSSVTLYCAVDQINPVLRGQLSADGIHLTGYDQVETDILQLPVSATLLLDPSSANVRLHDLVPCLTVEADMPSRHLKAIKSDGEVAHIRQAMIHDGVALAKTFYWLEQALEIDTVTEVELSQKLIEMRSQQPHYVSESFTAIVGYKGNGAIIHYKPEESTCADIHPDGMLLVDSGGQYLNGTTDITRTFSLSDPTEQQKLHYTLVLKGMITLTKAVFPVGTNGQQLDTLARMHLWDEGLNYAHGTGHGVGFFMNVHEPPQGFSPSSSSRGSTPHVPGMITSNEPGYYLEGEYGIRIENLLVTKEAHHDGYLMHETLTMYPMELALIDETCLSTREKAWLNKYQHSCYTLISPYLSEAEREWFKQKCKPLN